MRFLVQADEEIVQEDDVFPADLELAWRTVCPDDNRWDEFSDETVALLRDADPGALQSVLLRAVGDVEVCAAPKRVLRALATGLSERLNNPLFDRETIGIGSK